MLRMKPQILHISCHGVTKSDGQHLIFETETGEAIKMTKENLEKELEIELKSQDSLGLELVFVAAC